MHLKLREELNAEFPGFMGVEEKNGWFQVEHAWAGVTWNHLPGGTPLAYPPARRAT